METITATPKNNTEAKAVTEFLKRIKVKAEVYHKPTKQKDLDLLEKVLQKQSFM